MMFECQPPDNELFYDCGMKPISVRQCPPQPPCITPGMAIWVVKFPWKGHIRPISLQSIFEFWISVFISNLEKNRVQHQLDFFSEFELDFYCLCSLQKSISKSN